MIPGSQALLIMIFPPNKRGTALAIWSMTTLVAPICGPILGGYISDNFAWPWIFLINVPVGLLCAFLCWRGMSSPRDPDPQGADRHHRLHAAAGLGRRAAGHARHRQGSRLVQLAGHRRRDCWWRSSASSPG
jgi:MFS family permease